MEAARHEPAPVVIGEGVDETLLRSMRYVVLHTAGPVPGQRRAYEQVYAFWRETWHATFAEVAPGRELLSDGFVLHQEACAIFRNERVIGLMLRDFRDLRLRAHRELAVFQHYPPSALDALCDRGLHRVMVTAQLSVHPEFRRRTVGPMVSDALMALSVNRFLASSAAVMVGVTRNDRGVDRLAYRFGAVPLVADLETYGIPSDVVAFHREHMRAYSLPFGTLALAAE